MDKLDDKIKFKVNDKIFHVNKNKLDKFPNSYLTTLSKHQLEEEYIIIDRDDILFSSVIDVLNDGLRNIMHEFTSINKHELLDELIYYGLINIDNIRENINDIDKERDLMFIELNKTKKALEKLGKDKDILENIKNNICDHTFHLTASEEYYSEYTCTLCGYMRVKG